MKTVIVTGGSGYIGSAIIAHLLEEFRVINLDTDIKWNSNFDYNDNYHSYECDLSELSTLPLLSELRKIARGEGFGGIIHMAAWKDLTESYNYPKEYYENNFKATMTVMDLALELGIKKIIFSSSAAVYPDEVSGAISEACTATGPSPYGFSKLMCERYITEVGRQYGISTYCLRYQNPIGGIKGITSDKSESMFGNILTSIRDNKTFTIFGGNYPTEDGTCIRDYIDINDIADIHVYFLRNCNGYDNLVVNVGRGKPVSCKEICELVKSKYPKFEYVIGDRRPGDAAGSYADTTYLRSLGYDKEFTPMSKTVERIIEEACNGKD